MLSRLIAAVCAALAYTVSAAAEPVWTPQDGDLLEFDVLRNGKPFGAHSVKFDQSEDGLKVEIDIDLKVKVGPFTPFKYSHASEELWRDGQLAELSGRTRKDGKDFKVEAQASGDKLMIMGTEFDGEAPLGLIPASHWNKAQLDGEFILSTESGELLPVETEFIASEVIVAGGETVQARKYLLKSDLDVFLWYDVTGRWVKCAFEARGQKVEYVLRADDGASDA